MATEKTKLHNINLILTLDLLREIWSVPHLQADSPASMQNESSPEKSVSKWFAKMIQTENSRRKRYTGYTWETNGIINDKGL
jgi:hypothetical protein